jgi:transposase
MISFSGSLKIFLLVDCCDMRKGFNGLYGLVSSSFGEDPRNGALYVFCNRRHTRIKVLYFDGYATLGIMGQRYGNHVMFQGRAKCSGETRFP